MLSRNTIKSQSNFSEVLRLEVKQSIIAKIQMTKKKNPSKKIKNMSHNGKTKNPSIRHLKA